MPDFRPPEIDISDEVQYLLNEKTDAFVQDGLNLKSGAQLISHQQPHRPSGWRIHIQEFERCSP